MDMITVREKQGVIEYFFINPVRLGLLIFLVGAVWIGGLCAVSYLGAPVNPHPGRQTFITLTIKKGASLNEIGTLLEHRGLIKKAGYFVLYARWVGKEKRIEAGYYRLSPAWSLSQILDRLTGGGVPAIRVTIPEGYTTAQIERLLVSRGIVRDAAFRATVSSGSFPYSFLKGIPPGPNRLEGYLFPATYEFEPGVSEQEVVDQMLRSFQRVYTPDLQQRAADMGLSTRQVLILASLVEREAKLDRERPVIAAVFLNRLHRGMRLESCATIQYLLGKQKAHLTYADLKIPSPYNTYLHGGLPPGPIANPGLASIKAVLYPARVPYLYFVARGDGSHAFSLTLREHELATRRYVGD